MPWNAPFKDRSKVGIRDDQSGRVVPTTEVTVPVEIKLQRVAGEWLAGKVVVRKWVVGK